MNRPNAEMFASVELLRLIMDLPESYRIVAAENKAGEYGATIALLVEADRLPATEDGKPRHLLEPRWQRIENMQATLAEIRVTHSAERSEATP